MRWSRFFAISVSGLAAVVAVAASDLDATLGRLDQAFGKQVERIETDSAEKIHSLNGSYVRSLRRLEGMLQKKGELDPLLAVRRERERFMKERSLGDSGVLRAVPELASVQQAFLESLSAEQVAMADKILDLSERYKQSLGRLQTRLTREGDLSSALRVKKAASGVSALPAVASASFVKADNDGGAKEEVPAPSPKTAEPANEPFGAAAKERFRREQEDGTRKVIRKKYVDYLTAVGDRDFEKAVTYMDPGFISRVGSDAMRPFLEKYVPHIESMRSAGIELDGGKVVLNLATGTATNIPRFRIANNWKDGDPSAWIRVDDDWYLRMGD